MRLFRGLLVSAIATALLLPGGAAVAGHRPRHVTPFTVPSPGRNQSLYGVDALSPRVAWAVGYTYDGSQDDNLILRWKRGAWKVSPSPSPGGTSSADALQAVSAVSKSDAWAVGWYGTPTGYNTTTLHWNGSTWSVVPSPNPGAWNFLYGVVARSSTNAWAVGYYLDASSNYQTMALHWNGTTWTQVSSPSVGGTSTELWGVSAVSASDIWAVGASGTSTSSTFTMHWDGFVWTQVSSPSPGDSPVLSAVSAGATGNVWAVGNTFGTTSQQTLIEHWDGHAWTQVPSPNPAGPSMANVLTGTAAVSGSNAWAVGYAGGATMVLKWNGSSWSPVSAPSPGPNYSRLNAVSADSSSDAWAAGTNVSRRKGFDLLLHWDGATWTQA
jgi:hypothetical protein